MLDLAPTDVGDLWDTCFDFCLFLILPRCFFIRFLLILTEGQVMGVSCKSTGCIFKSCGGDGPCRIVTRIISLRAESKKMTPQTERLERILLYAF